MPEPSVRHAQNTIPAPSRSQSPPSETLCPPSPSFIETEPNEFGLYRSYMSYPTQDPEEALSLDDMCDAPGFSTAQMSSDRRKWWSGFGLGRQNPNDIFAPFLNATVFRLMNWFYGGSNMKSLAELDLLVKEVLLADDFDKKHLEGFSTARELGRLDKYMDTPDLHPQDGWKESSVKVRLPAEKVRHGAEDDAPEFEVCGVYHRSIVEVIKSTFQEPLAKTFHFTPFKLYWKSSPAEPPQRVISELYNSDAMLNEHQKIQAQPREPGCTLETAIAAMMLWSDSTHLANFGTASLWPIYAFFGNQSKYPRGMPTSFSAHHLAYIPSLPDTIQDVYAAVFDGMNASANTLTHLKRELIHAIWELLLDEEFMHAYEHGIVVECADGILRRLFPRFFTYSADYPEKFTCSSFLLFHLTDIYLTVGSSLPLSNILQHALVPAVWFRKTKSTSWGQTLI